jgi:polysaccharide biosynthesis/export protein
MTLTRQTTSALRTACFLFTILAVGGGCTHFLEPRSPYPITPSVASPESLVPRELDMVSLPPYTIAPPDILMINAIKVVPKPPHRLEPFDGIIVQALGVAADAPIANVYVIDPEGKIDLGPTYGRVTVVDLTIDEARDTIRRELSKVYGNVEVSVSLALSSGAQQIVGEHLVGPDGRVNLGTYGSVYVAGRTVEEARTAIETQLANYLDDPKVVVDVFAYNSMKYYIITQGGGLGDNVTTSPIVGNETVLDAIATVGGISQVSSTKIWIARPSPHHDCEQILPVDWESISRGASTATNYQLMPNDRLYIAEDPLVRFDSIVSRHTRPFERLFGFVSLGTAMLNRITRFGLGTF